MHAGPGRGVSRTSARRPWWNDEPMVRRPYPTLRDASYPAAADVWQALRETRAAPPGRASTGGTARRKTYGAALEQAEQLFRAAANVGPAARPLLLFYGLSQAARAVAAAAQAKDYQWTGHGIKTMDLDQPALGQVKARDAGTGAFTRMAALLGSRSLPSPAPLADLWTTILEVQDWPLRSAASAVEVLHVTPARQGPESQGALAVHLGGLPATLVPADPQDSAALTEAVRRHLAAFPTLSGFDFPQGIAQVRGRDTRRGRITIGMARTLGTDRQPTEDELSAGLAAISPWRGRSPTGHDRTVHSALGGDAGQLHPLLAWWAVLFTLSMLARYQPGQWTTQIDVNQSPDTVPVEKLLDAALAAVPELLLAAIEEVSA